VCHGLLPCDNSADRRNRSWIVGVREVVRDKLPSIPLEQLLRVSALGETPNLSRCSVVIKTRSTVRFGGACVTTIEKSMWRSVGISSAYTTVESYGRTLEDLNLELATTMPDMAIGTGTDGHGLSCLYWPRNKSTSDRGLFLFLDG
jgi:hypothetical protein